MKEKKNIEVELQGIEDRVMRLTPNSSQLGDAILVRVATSFLLHGLFRGRYGFVGERSAFTEYQGDA